MSNFVKTYRVKQLPTDCEPGAIYYVKPDNSNLVSAYVTDNDGVPHPVSSQAGGAIDPYQHVQAQAANQWVVNHNLGRFPVSARVLSPGGVEVLADVVNTSINQLVVSFASLQTGRVIVL